jgi:glycosyltransferase involved in cell wall biosynthesis
MPQDHVPRVSVVIPTCDRSELLRVAIQSVLIQTFWDFELVVVEDDPSGAASSVVSAFSDPRIRFFQHDIHRGASAARNTGIRESRGQYVLCLDDDDEILPQCLKKLVFKMDSAPLTVGVVHCGMRRLGAHGRHLGDSIPHVQGNARSHLLRGRKWGNVTALVRRECFERAGLFDDSLSSCQDWDLWLRVSGFFEFDSVPEVLMIHRWHGDQISSDLVKMIRGRTRMIEKHREAFAGVPGALTIHSKRLGKLHALNGTWKEAWHWFYEAAGRSPLEWAKVLAWIVLEYPFVRFSSPFRDFQRGKP